MKRTVPNGSVTVLCGCVFAGIVHENVKMGSDGESDQASGTSSDEVQSPVRVRMRNNHHRRISNEVQGPRDTRVHTPKHLHLHQMRAADCTWGQYDVVISAEGGSP